MSIAFQGWNKLRSMLQRLFPSTSIAVGLIVTAAWIGFLGYEIFELGSSVL
jgi:hypothetical protein